MESTLSFISEKLQNAGDTVEEIQNVGNTERLVSVVAGVLLTFYGLKHKETLLGKGLTFAGGLLMTRGTSGFCPVNKAVGRDTSMA